MTRLYKLLLLLAVIILSAIPSMAQSGQTTVTGTIQDSNGTLYINSPYTVTFYDPGTSGKLPLLNGSTFQRSYSGLATNSSGVLTISLPDNNVISSTSGATGTQWTFSICTPAGLYPTIYCIPPVNVTISGASQSITAAITAVAPVLPLPALGGVASANRVAYGTGPNTIGSSPNLTFNPSTSAVSAPNINNILYVDGVKYPTLASAMAAVPVSGAMIIDTLVEAFTVNPFASTANPVWVQFGAGIWTTTVPVVLSANQWITGAGPQYSKIKAIAGFASTTQGVITLGTTVENHAMYARDIGIDCNSIANCSGLIFDGAQNPAGASNVVITNYRVDGVRLQQTSAATSGVKLHDMWAYSPTGIAPSGSGVNLSAFSGTAIVENFTQASDHSFPGPSAFKAGGGSGEFTCINCAGEGITDQFLLTGTAVTTVIIGAGQQASSSPGVNTVHVGAGVSNYNLINVSQGNSTGAALVDDQRSYTCTGSIQSLVVSGGSTKFDFGSCPTIGWIRTPSSSLVIADLIQLQAGFSGTSRNYVVLDNNGNTQYGINNDGRISFHGNSGTAGATGIFQHSNTVNRTYTFPNFDGIVATSNAAQTWSGNQTGIPLVTPTIGGGTAINLYKTVTDTPGAITVNNLTCTDRAVALAGSGTGAIIGIAAAYALDANIYLSPAQAVAGTLHYRICNSSGGNITLNAAAAFNLMVLQ